LASLARAPTDFERVLFGQCPTHDATPAEQQGTQPGGGRGGPSDDAQPPGSPRLPAPDPQPQGPTAPGSSLGSGGSGGFHSGNHLGLIATVLSLAPLWGTRLITPFERRRPAQLFAFSLERPG